MKLNIALIFLSSLLNSALVIAECTANRNLDIVITKPDSLYTDHGDGTVTDNSTGLMWQKCSQGLSGSDCLTGSAQFYDWQPALTAAKTANTNNESGYSDWRLPNIKELESLAEDACFNPAINSSFFPNTMVTTYVEYWSSTPFLDSYNAWGVTFDKGEVTTDVMGHSNYVRLVRGGQ